MGACPLGPLGKVKETPPWQIAGAEREEFRARFRREAETLRHLRHPHL
jgi:hypothetical protein